MTTPTLMTTSAPGAAVTASYETLRRVALGDPAPCDGPSLGFALLLRQGLAAWLEAWAICPGPMVPSVRTSAVVSVPAVPSLVHHELAQVWAHIVLLQQEVAWSSPANGCPK